MAGIARTTQAIFSTTGLTPTAGFGAAAAGTTTTEAGSSNTAANLQTGTSGAWAGGWNSATLGSSKFPAEEDLNAVLNVITSQLGYVLERGIPEYDAGTTYNHYDICKKVGTFQLYGSITDSNTGNALTDTGNWLYLCDLSTVGNQGNLFTGGTTTGSANAQTLASLSPATGFSLSNNGQTIAFTVGYTNTSTTTLAITSPSISATAVKKDSGAGLINLTAGDLVAGNTAFVTVNTTAACFVLVDGPPLGTVAPTNLDTTNFQNTAGNLAFGTAPVLPNGATATTQSASDNSTKLATTAYADRNIITLGTPVATTSGTSTTFTIPTGVKKITVNFQGFSTNGTSIPIIQIGPSGGVETSGYVGVATLSNTAGNNSTAWAGSGIMLAGQWYSTVIAGGSITLSLLDATNNIWAVAGVTTGRSGTAETNVTAGQKPLAGALNKLTIKATNGTDTFTAGSVNVMYQ